MLIFIFIIRCMSISWFCSEIVAFRYSSWLKCLSTLSANHGRCLQMRSRRDEIFVSHTWSSALTPRVVRTWMMLCPSGMSLCLPACHHHLFPCNVWTCLSTGSWIMVTCSWECTLLMWHTLWLLVLWLTMRQVYGQLRFTWLTAGMTCFLLSSVLTFALFILASTGRHNLICFQCWKLVEIPWEVEIYSSLPPGMLWVWSGN